MPLCEGWYIDEYQNIDAEILSPFVIWSHTIAAVNPVDMEFNMELLWLSHCTQYNGPEISYQGQNNHI